MTAPSTPVAIPFHRPSIGPAEREAVLEVLDSGWLTTGERTLAFEEATRAAVGTRQAVAVNSATAALHLALEALDVGPGDEVIVPTYTFATCGEVVRYLGARPRLVDVEPRTLEVTAGTIAPHLRPETKAIMVVHFGGLVADIVPILALAAEHGIAVVEDVAHAIPATRDGRQAGSFGVAGALSFYETKTVTTGEGGMLVTDDDALADRARVMRLHGISRDAWKRYTAGGSWYYEIEDVGFKYNLTDLAAAIGLVQLERAEAMRRERERVARAYGRAVEAYGLSDVLELPVDAPLGDRHAWHLYPVRLAPDATVSRAEVIERLRADGIGTSVHFIPLHLHPYYRDTLGCNPSDCPRAASIYAELISLPLYPDVTVNEVDYVCSSLKTILARSHSTVSGLRLPAEVERAA